MGVHAEMLTAFLERNKDTELEFSSALHVQ
jgi:hypothetical protein